jgi:hypothetical protein
MRSVVAVVVAVCGLAAGGTTARAGDSGPVIVIPGKPGVPVLMNGYDVSGAIIEGDWGLYRPGAVTPTIYGPIFLAAPTYDRGYFPAYGRRPGYGRYEIEPPPDRRLPPPAPTYQRLWTSESDPVPASLEPPASAPIVVAPQIQRRRFGRRPHHN